MHTIDIPEKGLVLQLPSEWDDCTREQAHFILSKAFDVMAGLLSISEFRVQVFIKLTGLKFGLRYLIKQKLGLNSEANERIYQLSHLLCDWVFLKNEEENYELNYETVQNFFPVIADRFFGPEDMLADLTLGEFKNALGALDLYFESKETPEEAITHLDYFLGILYRSKDQNGIKKPHYNYVIDTEPFQKVPIWQKQSIIIWFTYCVKCLQTEDIVINGIECNLNVLFPKPKGTNASSAKVNLGWTGILMDIAESGVFGDASSASQTSLYDVLLFMLKKHQDQPKQK